MYDFLGKEIKAIPLYEEAIHLGLNDEWEAYAFLQLGSSLKNIGNINDAITVLSTAEKRFPHLPSISMFLAITLHYANMDAEGLKTVMKAILRQVKTSDIERYKFALDKYINEL